MGNEKCNDAIRRSDCPISSALDAIGDKWSMLILRDLMFSGKRTYGEFQSSGEGIATNILAARLSTMEANGLLTKAPDPENGRRNIYSLTEKGLDLLPVLVAINNWMLKWDKHAKACTESLKACRKSAEKVISERMEELRATHLPHRRKAGSRTSA